MYIIAKDGFADFTTIQAAVDAIPENNEDQYLLVVRKGVYDERVIVNKDHVRIAGESRDETVITHSACAHDLDENGQQKGTFLSYTFIVTGKDVEVENITIRNDAGDGRDVGQAVAVYAAGDRGVWRNVRMIANQDTLFCGPTMPKVAKDALPHVLPEGVPSVGDCPPVLGRQYFENCFIQGDVDFIFGPYRCWFEGCTLHMNERGGWYTAANTPEENPWGMVFHACRLTGECAPGQAYLGRPWRRFARTLFLNCEMDECVAAEGFQDWADKPVTARCGEYGSFGPGAKGSRHPGQALLTREEAEGVTLTQIMDGWNPADRPAAWFMCGDSTMANYRPHEAPMTGWGQALRPLVPQVRVENHARCGRSSKSFIEEGYLPLMEAFLRPGDRMFIQFGHNDEKEYSKERGTDPHSTFPAFLTQYIDMAQAHGVEPILLTPIARRHFDENGVLLHTHGEYPDAIRTLAKKRGLRLLDMEMATEELLARLGDEPSKALYNWQEEGHPNYPQGVKDNTHLCLTGAQAYAKIALELLGE